MQKKNLKVGEDYLYTSRSRKYGYQERVTLVDLDGEFQEPYKPRLGAQTEFRTVRGIIVRRVRDGEQLLLDSAVRLLSTWADHEAAQAAEKAERERRQQEQREKAAYVQKETDRIWNALDTLVGEPVLRTALGSHSYRMDADMRLSISPQTLLSLMASAIEQAHQERDFDALGEDL